MKENGVEEETANGIAGFGLVPITERYAIRIATKVYETDDTCITRGRPLQTKRRLCH